MLVWPDTYTILYLYFSGSTAKMTLSGGGGGCEIGLCIWCISEDDVGFLTSVLLLGPVANKIK